jgi:hypothetical protein
MVVAVLPADGSGRRLGVPVGIVIGRAQHEGLIAISVGNEERVKFRLVESN